MFEQDYVMRLVREIARMLAKILFNIDSKGFADEILDEIEEKDELRRLLEHIDNGRINEAENRLFALLDEGAADSIAMAIVFYSHLNDKSDEFLQANNYSRQEVQEGIEGIAKRTGLQDIINNHFSVE